MTTSIRAFELERLAPDGYGSHLFERITQVPEYYLIRIERAILAHSAIPIITEAQRDGRRPLRLVELGAGTASKTALLLDAVVRLQGEVLYLPIDVSLDALDIARSAIAALLPHVRVEPIVANYVAQPPRLESFEGTTLAIYLGSSIGNFRPEEARAILRSLALQLKSGDALLLGTDMVKDEAILLTAYADKDGITAAFNLNILSRLNREIGADFDLTTFRHRILWNRDAPRIEMHLQSTHDQRLRIPLAGLDIRFAALEAIHTESSYKFTYEAIRALLEAAGFAVEDSWTDPHEWYTVTLARLP